MIISDHGPNITVKMLLQLNCHFPSTMLAEQFLSFLSLQKPTAVTTAGENLGSP